MQFALDRIHFAYPGGPSVIEDGSLEIEQGSFVLVRGPSGSGKSTLLRLLCRLEEPQKGTIFFNEDPVQTLDPAAYRRSVAYVQQLPNLIDATVRDNLTLPFSFKANNHLSSPDDDVLHHHLAAFLLDDVGLDADARSLSVGQSQRVCLIRSLLLAPEAILMDEPTASLDLASARVVLKQAADLRRSGVTVVMISHSEYIPPGITHTATILDRKLEYA